MGERGNNVFHKKKKEEEFDINYTSAFSAEYVNARYKELAQEELKQHRISKTLQSPFNQ